jgi:hypothetical protein
MLIPSGDGEVEQKRGPMEWRRTEKQWRQPHTFEQSSSGKGLFSVVVKRHDFQKIREVGKLFAG